MGAGPLSVAADAVIAAPTWDGLAPDVGRTLVVLAPHPDDEVLGCGGLLRWAVGRGVAVRLVAVTDGEASHRRSACITPAALVERRAAERAAALEVLGVDRAVTVTRLGLPDGAVAACEDRLARMVVEVVDRHRSAGGVTLVAPRDDDGHPDHDATARAAACAAATVGAPVWSVAIWAKVHRPAALGAGRRLHLDSAARAAKSAAVAAFRSQLVALGPGPLDGPVVHPHEVAAMLAGPEVVTVP